MLYIRSFFIGTAEDRLHNGKDQVPFLFAGRAPKGKKLLVLQGGRKGEGVLQQIVHCDMEALG